eukprot:scaffold3079_cov174-Amphora_coffeaeformis.AAC.14
MTWPSCGHGMSWLEIQGKHLETQPDRVDVTWIAGVNSFKRNITIFETTTTQSCGGHTTLDVIVTAMYKHAACRCKK